MIYPLNETVERIYADATDEETGELLISEEELTKKIEAAHIERDEMLKALRNAYMNDVVSAECVEAEASALWKLQRETSKRADTIRNRAERRKRYMAWLLNGEKYDKDGVRVSYTTRKVVEYEDGFVDWAIHEAPGLLNEPTIRKKDVEAALKANENIKFAHFNEKKYVVVK